jgi:hypothetical protein
VDELYLRITEKRKKEKHKGLKENKQKKEKHKGHNGHEWAQRISWMQAKERNTQRFLSIWWGVRWVGLNTSGPMVYVIIWLAWFAKGLGTYYQSKNVRMFKYLLYLEATEIEIQTKSRLPRAQRTGSRNDNGLLGLEREITGSSPKTIWDWRSDNGLLGLEREITGLFPKNSGDCRISLTKISGTMRTLRAVRDTASRKSRLDDRCVGFRVKNLTPHSQNALGAGSTQPTREDRNHLPASPKYQNAGFSGGVRHWVSGGRALR